MDILPHEKKIHEYVKTIEHLKKQSKDNPLFTSEIDKLEKKLIKLKESVYNQLSPWERIQICRHVRRPKTSDYIEHLFSEFHELSGDRLYSNDPSIIGGLGRINGLKCVVIGQEKGKDTESRVYRNFGMMCPEGYRKALRLMQLAEKFHLPVVTFIDTPGAFPGLEAEERGQGWAIAHNLREMSALRTPIISIVTAEGCSGGALGIGVSDVIGMLEHSYYSVISPEGCASILWRDSGKNQEAAAALKLNAEDLEKMNIIDQIIKEPLGGAHHDPEVVYQNVQQFLLEQLHVLRRIPLNMLLEQRYQKYRIMGKWTEE